MDHSRRWVNGSSQGLSYAIVAELFTRNQQECLILSLSRHCPLFLLSFYVLSSDISASDLVIEVDCCEMTICNSKLIISLYYWAEMQAIMTKHSARKQQSIRQKAPALGISSVTFHPLSATFTYDQAFLIELLLITICDITG